MEQSSPSLLGLSEAEAQARLRAEGPNQLPRAARRGFVTVVLGTLREPMFALLLGAGLLYLVLGDFGEAVILLLFATVSVTIAIVQESRSERVLEALRDLTSPRALVIRAGQRQRIAGREVVRGDVVILAEGDRVPADGVLRQAHDLAIDESLLTGEAAAVRKSATRDSVALARPGGEDLPFAYSGSLVVRGSGVSEILATGPRSEIGRIGLALGTIESEVPPLQRQTGRLVQTLALFGLSVSAAVASLYVALRGSWLDGLLGGIALGMSLLPEEVPLVLTVFMVMGAWRISQARVLTRRAAAIETLGAASILCTDKTGTLTQNRMTVAALWQGGAWFRSAGRLGETMPAPMSRVIEAGWRASAPHPTDPMEIAFHDFARAQLPRERMEAPGEVLRAYGLRPDLLAVAQIWRAMDRAGYEVAAKGAPEAIAHLCRLDERARHEMQQAADAMAAEGMRVLGVARADFTGGGFPDSLHDFAFAFLGLVGLADPLRPGVADAVRECRSAGIEVAMITGDYAKTAEAIARAAGIDETAVMTGMEIAGASDAALAERVQTTRIFARVLPEQKLRLVNAFKANGGVVAMTGDGVNDAPALKSAHIGIAMGGRGTDVAREAASIVLLDDDFGSIVHTIRLGRRIYDNLRKAMGYILAVHVVIAGVALLPLLLGWPLILAPIHIVFLEMVIDPVCSIVFEAEPQEKDAMQRRPRDVNSPLFSGSLILWGLVQGLAVFVLIAIIFAGAMGVDMPENEVRAEVFVTLVASNFGLIFVNRSFSTSVLAALRRKNRALWAVLAITAALLSLVLPWPPARALFRFGPLHADDLAFSIGGAILILVALQAAKSIWRTKLTG